MVSDLISQAVGEVMLTRWLMNRFCEIKLRKKKKSQPVAFSWDSFKNYFFAFFIFIFCIFLFLFLVV